MPRPMLDSVELEQVQKIEAEDQEVLAQHGVPALEGDFLQDLGRRVTRVSLSAVITGAGADERLKTLREKFRSATPVPFVADIATATKVDKVLIEEFGVREVAGKPERFEYELTLREFIPAPKPEQEEPPPPPPPPPDPEVLTGTLIVEVIVEGQPNFDFNKVTVTVEGTKDDGTTLTPQNLTTRANNIWTEQPMALGQFTVKAVVTDPPAMSGSAAATVRAGQTTQVTITLRPGATIAKAFIIHFRFDRAFVEPCMREVLQQVFRYAEGHPDEKILIVGHTDLTGSDDYNQSLSERRARAVFATMTFGTSADLRNAAIEDWDNLRKGPIPRAGLNDGWGTREYQYMLQDLRHYVGNIDEEHGPKTDQAVRNFQRDKGLPQTGVVNDATWRALVEAYLEAGALDIPETRFLPNKNSEKGCDSGILKWLGCGEKDPVKNTQEAWRPNRRVEILFVVADKLPCQVPKPVTFDKPTPGAVNSQWCLGPDTGTGADRHCFIARGTAQPNKFLVQPAEPDKVVVSGTIVFDDGTPVANEKYILIAPDGEFLHTDANGKANGEGPQGRPILNTTDNEGKFSYPEQTPVGTYILEMPKLREPFVSRAQDEPPPEAIGNVVCFRLEVSPQV